VSNREAKTLPISPAAITIAPAVVGTASSVCQMATLPIVIRAVPAAIADSLSARDKHTVLENTAATIRPAAVYPTIARVVAVHKDAALPILVPIAS